MSAASKRSPYHKPVWSVFGVVSGMSFAIAAVINVHAEPVVAIVVAGVSGVLAVTQPARQGTGGGPGQGRRRNRNRNR
ncbi:MAG: hypothetical protein ACRDJU_10260 [Actinomycetota bacterium]